KPKHWNASVGESGRPILRLKSRATCPSIAADADRHRGYYSPPYLILSLRWISAKRSPYPLYGPIYGPSPERKAIVGWRVNPVAAIYSACLRSCIYPTL